MNAPTLLPCPCAAGTEDWVVDTLALHDHMHLLRDVLADPGVVKVWA